MNLNQHTTANHPRLDDRVQQIVFIGRKADAAALRVRLHGCFLDEGLASAGSNAWVELRNPFAELSAAGEQA